MTKSGQKTHYIRLVVVALFVLSGCISGFAQEKKEDSDFKYWESKIYNELNASKIYGSLIIQPSPEIDKDSEIIIFDKSFKTGRYIFNIGNFRNEDVYELMLPPGDYKINVSTASSFFKKAILRELNVKIESGTQTMVVAEKDALKFLINSNNLKLSTKRGSIFSSQDIIYMMQARVVLQLGSYVNNELKIFARVFNGNGIPKFKINGQDTYFDSKWNIVQNGIEYSFNLNLKEGQNNFEVEVYGNNGNLVMKNIEYYVKTTIELEQERIAKQRQELDRMARIEAERRTRIAEEERIAREGDGSPDDLQCKRYGLKPQTQGYAECRMRLDLSRKETAQRIENQKKQIAAQQELIRQQEQNAANARAARESQCRFIQSAEYLKPTTTGNFFESATRANTAFENCMNGVPTINTTCTRDGAGNMNCTSR